MCVLSAVEPPVAPFPLYVTVYIPFQFAVSVASSSPIVNVTASVVEVDDRLPLVFVHPLNTWFVLVGIPIVFVSPLHNENVCAVVAPSHVPPFGFTVNVYIFAQFAVRFASAVPIVNVTSSVVDSDDSVLPSPVFVHPLNTYPSLVGTGIACVSPSAILNGLLSDSDHVPSFAFTVNLYFVTSGSFGSATLFITALHFELFAHLTVPPFVAKSSALKIPSV